MEDRECEEEENKKDKEPKVRVNLQMLRLHDLLAQSKMAHSEDKCSLHHPEILKPPPDSFS